MTTLFYLFIIITICSCSSTRNISYDDFKEVNKELSGESATIFIVENQQEIKVKNLELKPESSSFIYHFTHNYKDSIATSNIKEIKLAPQRFIGGVVGMLIGIASGMVIGNIIVEEPDEPKGTLFRSLGRSLAILNWTAGGMAVGSVIGFYNGPEKKYVINHPSK